MNGSFAVLATKLSELVRIRKTLDSANNTVTCWLLQFDHGPTPSVEDNSLHMRSHVEAIDLWLPCTCDMRSRCCQKIPVAPDTTTGDSSIARVRRRNTQELGPALMRSS